MVERRGRDVSGKWIYLCYPCAAVCSGESILQTHISGKKHKVKLSARVVWPLSIFDEHPYVLSEKGMNKNKTGEATEQVLMKIAEEVNIFNKDVTELDEKYNSLRNVRCHIQDSLDSIKAPVLGVEYLVEHPPEEPHHEPSYICSLCNKQGHPRTIINHLTCFWHRYNYLPVQQAGPPAHHHQPSHLLLASVQLSGQYLVEHPPEEPHHEPSYILQPVQQAGPPAHQSSTISLASGIGTTIWSVPKWSTRTGGAAPRALVHLQPVQQAGPPAHHHQPSHLLLASVQLSGQYLVEHPPEEPHHEPSYICSLCNKQGHPRTIINHLTCFWHRYNYLWSTRRRSRTTSPRTSAACATSRATRAPSSTISLASGIGTTIWSVPSGAPAGGAAPRALVHLQPVQQAGPPAHHHQPSHLLLASVQLSGQYLVEHRRRSRTTSPRTSAACATSRATRAPSSTISLASGIGTTIWSVPSGAPAGGAAPRALVHLQPVQQAGPPAHHHQPSHLLLASVQLSGQYLVEHPPEEPHHEPSYICSLCNKQGHPRTIINHLTCFWHRYNYLWSTRRRSRTTSPRTSAACATSRATRAPSSTISLASGIGTTIWSVPSGAPAGGAAPRALVHLQPVQQAGPPAHHHQPSHLLLASVQLSGQYLVEHPPEEPHHEPSYICSLCNKQGHPRTIINHLTCFWHRYNYLWSTRRRSRTTSPRTSAACATSRATRAPSSTISLASGIGTTIWSVPSGAPAGGAAPRALVHLQPVQQAGPPAHHHQPSHLLLASVQLSGQYLVEHPPEEPHHEPSYICSLCNKQGHPRTIINHLTCFWHRATRAPSSTISLASGIGTTIWSVPSGAPAGGAAPRALVHLQPVQQAGPPAHHHQPSHLLLASVQLSGQYLVEHPPEEPHHEPSYICSLCNKQGHPRTIINHLTCFWHRYNYLLRHFSKASTMLSPYKSQASYREGVAIIMNRISQRIEDKFGRMKPVNIDKAVYDKEKDRIHLWIYKGKHFTEKDGHTFEEVVDIDLIESLNKKGKYEKKDPSPPVVKAPSKSLFNSYSQKPPNYEYKVKLAEEQRLAAEDAAKKTLAYHEKNPEKHPLYPEEWKKFWNRRYKEIQSEGKDPSKHDYKPEWIVFWTARMKELHDEELRVHLSEIYRKMCLSPPPLVSERKNDKAKSPAEQKHSDLKRRSPELKRRSPDLRRRSPELRRRSPEPRRRSPEPRRRSPFSRRRSPDFRRRSPDLRRRSSDPRRRSPDPRRRSPEVHRRSPPRYLHQHKRSNDRFKRDYRSPMIQKRLISPHSLSRPRSRSPLRR
ncbi:hypothetical protein ACJJTC_018870 [Scirpophaga incertulas]